MTFEIKGNVAKRISDRLEVLKDVEVSKRVHACGCCGRSDGSWRCSNH